MPRSQKDLRIFLDRKVEEYNRPAFILQDPISIPHQFSRKQDIEIAGFFAAIFSWGNRTTIIRKSRELMQLMDQSPYQFILQHEEQDLKRLLDFKHRTFNATDLLYFIAFFRFHYTHYDSLEDAFLMPWEGRTSSLKEGALSAFYYYFFSLEEEDLTQGPVVPLDSTEGLRHNLSLRRKSANDGTSSRGPLVPLAPHRTHKHIASPEKNSSCKRLNMFLRWMVRKDDRGVDFGIWNKLSPSRLICPLDVHVARVAKNLGLLTRTQSDWQAALELTDYLLILDKEDPVKYDFALFGLGALEKF
ncbi:MAG TPA: TIGR02757 family protein [Puia sp.]|nr:TIGR02757 family protein [Puia sp.]